MSDIIIKILTIGESGVGKTSFINQYIEKTFTTNFLSTIGIDFKTTKVHYKGETIKLLLYDTSGQERFRAVVKGYYKNAEGILFVYDVTNKDTLDKFEFWLSEISNNVEMNKDFIVMFGNKSDLKESRQVKYEEGKSIADKYGITFFEGSVKNNINITETIQKLVSTIGEKKLEEVQKEIDGGLKKHRTNTLEKNKTKKSKGCC